MEWVPQIDNKWLTLINGKFNNEYENLSSLLMYGGLWGGRKFSTYSSCHRQAISVCQNFQHENFHACLSGKWKSPSFHWERAPKNGTRPRPRLRLATHTSAPHQHRQRDFIIIQLRLLHISAFICVVSRVMFVSISHFDARCSTLTHKHAFRWSTKKIKYLPAIYICRVCVCFSV